MYVFSSNGGEAMVSKFNGSLDIGSFELGRDNVECAAFEESHHSHRGTERSKFVSVHGPGEGGTGAFSQEPGWTTTVTQVLHVERTKAAPRSQFPP